MPQATKGQIRKQLAHYVREQTGDGQEIIDLYLTILRNKAVTENGTAIKTTLRMQMEAGAFLMERGYGKAPQEISIEAAYADDQEELENWDLEKLEAAIRVTAVTVIPDALSKDG